MDITVYNRSTGEITRFYQIQSAQLLPELKADEAFVEGMGDADTHWVEEWDIPAIGTVAHILEREPVPFEIDTLSAEVGAPVIISNLPSSARIIIDMVGEGYLLGGDSAISISFDTPKAYTILITDVFPYLPTSFEVVIT